MLKFIHKYKFSKTHYQILGLTKQASQGEIKSSFYTLAKQYHPDTNKDPQNIEHFKLITQAYNILSDANEKAKYDRSLQDAEQQNSQSQQSQQSSTGQQSQYNKYTNTGQRQQQQKAYDFTQERQEKPMYDFEKNFYSQQEQGYEPGFLNSMRKAPELYIFSLVFMVICFRWYSTLLDQRAQGGHFSYPEDPEFIKERERDHEKRFGKQRDDRKALYKLSNLECKKVPVEILSEMEKSKRYILPPLCYERLDEFRGQQGADFDDDYDEEEEVPKPKRSLGDALQKAQVFRVRGAPLNTISKENVDQIMK